MYVTTAPRPLRQSECDCDCACDTPAWFSAAEKLGFAISAARFGCAAKAANAFWFDESVARAADWLLTAAKADGLAAIAEKACGLASIAWDAAALSLPAAEAVATSDWAFRACRACDAWRAGRT